MQLNCVINNASRFSEPFSLEINGSDSVEVLKGKIIEKNPRQLGSVDPSEIILWKIDVSFKDLQRSLDHIEKISEQRLSPLDEIQEIFLEEPGKKHIHILVELPQKVGESSSISPLKRAIDNDVIIPTSGPVLPNQGLLMLPIYERKSFGGLIKDIRQGASYIIHGPYQSGKTSVLLALKEELMRRRIDFAVIDMTSVFNYRQEFGLRKGFYNLLSYRIFHEYLQFPELHYRLGLMEGVFYILIDEFQCIFQDNILLEEAKRFFKEITMHGNIFYIAAGTFKLVDLMLPGENYLESPFNKAHFLRIPFFTTEDMGKLFQWYKERCNGMGVSDRVQAKIISESSGHPASFMILLRLFDECRPTSETWSLVLQKQLQKYMNGTHIKIKQAIEAKSKSEREYIRELTNNQGYPWRINLCSPSIIDKELLDIGILVTTGERDEVCFTSSIILRVCMEVVWPKPISPKIEVNDPIELLIDGLRLITPETIADKRISNKGGPSEAAFQAALYHVWNSLLPSPMLCLFEVHAKGLDTLDLMIVKGEDNWAAYELKVNKLSETDFRPSIKQAKKYAEHYKMKVYLVNFYLEGHQTPVVSDLDPDVVLVNVMHSASCKRFIVSARNYAREVRVIEHNQS
ncbi:uncharacterized protein VTP21DRAFT_9688 [Calcarisporiella thermophila]|uniref:uncharacterized protein n=1 Tax=Calcarisporiella thermophila TaxID=911321 RepID=UPI0037432D03